MLLIILLIIVIRSFYNLCKTYNKSKWFILLGIAAYFIGEFTAGLILGVLDGIFTIGIEWENTFFMALIGLPSGILTIIIVYYFLKRNWNKEAKRKQNNLESSIDNIGNDLNRNY